MKADQNLFDHAVELINRRWRDASFAVAAAIYLDDGTVLTGVSLDNFNSAMNLCAETGPMCEAYSRDSRVVASICVSREDGRDGFTVLAPCGACQERLALWGPDVQVGVSDPHNSDGWSTRALVELNPYYWATAFANDGSWPSAAQHAS
jgi:cytidine deaminase